MKIICFWTLSQGKDNNRPVKMSLWVLKTSDWKPCFQFSSTRQNE